MGTPARSSTISHGSAQIAVQKHAKNRQTLAWHLIAIIVGFHIATAWALLTTRFSLISWTFGLVYGLLGGFGVTGGTHRLWTHRSYKAKLPLRIFLMLCHCSTGQIPLLQWVRDHRVHHKCVDTDADPHNSKRGLFYSHIGWMMMRRHSEVLREGAKIDYSDLLADPVIQFDRRFHWPLVIIFAFIVPTAIPVFAWNEAWTISSLASIVRAVVAINAAAAVNSIAHTYGSKPYDKRITPTDHWLVSLLANGEGWHNYHHTFPWDYKASEHPYFVNLTTILIDGFAKVGWAYDLKSPSKELVDSVATRHGDRSRYTSDSAYAQEVTYSEYLQMRYKRTPENETEGGEHSHSL